MAQVARRASVARLFEMVSNGTIDVRTGARFPLSDAASARMALEGRSTTGSTILLP
jgi:NADPH2:quinone reductase